jgi:transposase
MSQPIASELKSKTNRKRYCEEFKINAIKLLEEGNRTQQVLATELGISVVTLGEWKRRYGTAVVEARFASKGKTGRNAGSPIATAFECARLQRELDHMTRQCDILKKALGIFSQQPPPSTR